MKKLHCGIALTVWAFAALPAYCGIETDCPRPEPKLVQSKTGDHLAEALSPIHFYLQRNMMLRLTPPSHNLFNQRFQGLSPMQPTRRNR